MGFLAGITNWRHQGDKSCDCRPVNPLNRPAQPRLHFLRYPYTVSSTRGPHKFTIWPRVAPRPRSDSRRDRAFLPPRTSLSCQDPELALQTPPEISSSCLCPNTRLRIISTSVCFIITLQRVLFRFCWPFDIWVRLPDDAWCPCYGCPTFAQRCCAAVVRSWVCALAAHMENTRSCVPRGGRDSAVGVCRKHASPRLFFSSLPSHIVPCWNVY